MKKTKNRLLELSQTVSSLYNKLSSYTEEMSKYSVRDYESVRDLNSSSSERILQIADELKSEFRYARRDRSQKE